MADETEPVGIYCNHEDEPADARTHEGWEWPEDEGRQWMVQPNVYMSHGTMPAEGEPRCPRAVPVYAVDVPALMRALADWERKAVSLTEQRDTAMTERDKALAEVEQLRGELAERDQRLDEAAQDEARITHEWDQARMAIERMGRILDGGA